MNIDIAYLLTQHNPSKDMRLVSLMFNVSYIYGNFPISINANIIKYEEIPDWLEKRVIDLYVKHKYAYMYMHLKKVRNLTYCYPEHTDDNIYPIRAKNMIVKVIDIWKVPDVPISSIYESVTVKAERSDGAWRTTNVFVNDGCGATHLISNARVKTYGIESLVSLTCPSLLLCGNITLQNLVHMEMNSLPDLESRMIDVFPNLKSLILKKGMFDASWIENMGIEYLDVPYLTCNSRYAVIPSVKYLRVNNGISIQRRPGLFSNTETLSLVGCISFPDNLSKFVSIKTLMIGKILPKTSIPPNVNKIVTMWCINGRAEKNVVALRYLKEYICKNITPSLESALLEKSVKVIVVDNEEPRDYRTRLISAKKWEEYASMQYV